MQSVGLAEAESQNNYGDFQLIRHFVFSKYFYWMAADMDRRLLQAAMSGDASTMRHMALQDPNVLLGRTPVGNTCLHISTIHGHEGFCRDVLEANRALVAVVNRDRETPLLVAITNGHVSLASFFLSFCRRNEQSEAILQKDSYGCNALHHAIRSGHKGLAMELIEAEPALSKDVNEYDESPMFIAVMRDYADISKRLLEIPDSADRGTFGFNSLHAAVRNGNSDIAKWILERRPTLALEINREGDTPVALAVLLGKTDVLRVLLEHDSSLGYAFSEKSISLYDAYIVGADTSIPLIVSASRRGHVGVARELLKHCPDAPYRTGYFGCTCLHEAVNSGHTEFVEFVMGTQQLRNKLINMRDSEGKTALHYAVKNCNPRILAALLSHTTTDFTMISNKDGRQASSELLTDKEPTKISDWNEVSMLLLKADPNNATHVYSIHKFVKDKLTNVSSKAFKSLTQTLISNTFLVAILIATITFAAAFTLPGGYSNDAGSEGLPIMVRKAAFQAFLISDALAMCSSLAVAFICIVAKWEDIGFLLYYRSFTKKLMWFSYMATITAFATGLYTVLSPRLLWLAIAICTLPVLLPIFTKLLDELPLLSLRFRLGRTFKSELLDIV